MRRSPIDCHRAVQSLRCPPPQHVWISDELLSSTINQFFRIPHHDQRRYGSHVPGPLEARRRAAKRRISASAGFYPQENFPLAFNLGALFGFAKDPQPTWRYEPPSLPQKRAQLPSSPDATNITSQSLPVASSDPTIFQSRLVAEERILSRLDVLGRASGTEADHIGETTEAVKNVGAVTLDSCLEAFKSKLARAGDLPAAERQQLLGTVYEACRPPDTSVRLYNLQIIEYLAEQAWNSLSLIQRILRLGVPPAFTTETIRLSESLFKLAVSFPQHRLVHVRSYCDVVKKGVRGGQSTNDLKDKDALRMIQQLWHIAPTKNNGVQKLVTDTLSLLMESLKDGFDCETLSFISSNLAENEGRLPLLIVPAVEQDALRSSAVQVLQSLPHSLLKRKIGLITEHLLEGTEITEGDRRGSVRQQIEPWLQMLHQVGGPPSIQKFKATFVDRAISYVLKYILSSETSGCSKMEQVLELLFLRSSLERSSDLSARRDWLRNMGTRYTSGIGQSHRVSTDPTSLAMFFARMHQDSLIYQDLLAKSIVLFTDTLPTVFILDFLAALKATGVPIHDTATLDRLHTLELAKLMHASTLTSKEGRQQFAYCLHTFQRLLDTLNELQSTYVAINYVKLSDDLKALRARYQFEHVLERAHAMCALPLAFRKIEANVTDQMRISLIHQLAHQYSEDTSVSQRQAWRAIYYLYKFVKENELPLGPLFSKAIVRSSIIRPMSEHRFVSVRRLTWVCNVVAAVEGQAEAEKIENIFWHWRGDIIKHAKSVYVAIGGDNREKASISTMKRLGLM